MIPVTWLLWIVPLSVCIGFLTRGMMLMGKDGGKTNEDYII